MAKAKTKVEEKIVVDPKARQAEAYSLLSKRRKDAKVSDHCKAGKEERESMARFVYVGDLLFQYALGRPGYRTTKIATILGKEGTGKTTRMLHILKTFMSVGGLGVYIETDYGGDVNEVQARGALGEYYEAFADSMWSPYSFNEALVATEETLLSFQKMDKEIPKVIVFDSVAGSGTSSVVDKWEPGKAGAWAEKARMLSDGIEHFKPLLWETNTTLFFGNQGKVKIETGAAAMGHKREMDTIKGQGGSSIDFSATYWEHLTKQAGGMAASEGFTIQTQYRKNKVDSPGRTFMMDVIFGQGPSFIRNTIKSLKDSGVGIRAKGGWYWCPAIGIKEEDHMRAEDLYNEIHKPENVGHFITELGIKYPRNLGQISFPLSWEGKLPDIDWDRLDETIARRSGYEADGTAVQAPSEEEDEEGVVWD